jgi:hypothetical protein
MAFQNPDRFNGDVRKRPQIGPVRGSSTFGDKLFTFFQLLIIFTMLRVVMVATGLMFFYIPYYDTAISLLVETMRNYFE